MRGNAPAVTVRISLYFGALRASNPARPVGRGANYEGVCWGLDRAVGPIDDAEPGGGAAVGIDHWNGGDPLVNALARPRNGALAGLRAGFCDQILAEGGEFLHDCRGHAGFVAQRGIAFAKPVDEVRPHFRDLPHAPFAV